MELEQLKEKISLILKDVYDRGYEDGCSKVDLDFPEFISEMITQILDLLPKGDEEGLVDIDSLWEEYEKTDPDQDEPWEHHLIAAQQLLDNQKHQREKEEIFGKIEERFGFNCYDYADKPYLYKIKDITEGDWQALKKEVLE